VLASQALLPEYASAQMPNSSRQIAPPTNKQGC
jgi:hypothetical protein